ncbi:hypothetical protein FRC02_000381 [Tulasnella sp. 418]|nr:hypothetical protein FRC02_000381 [Tulasnella sp. 418]
MKYLSVISLLALNVLSATADSSWKYHKLDMELRYKDKGHEFDVEKADPDALPPSIQALQSDMREFAEEFGHYVNCGCQWGNVRDPIIDLVVSVDELRNDYTTSYEGYDLEDRRLVYAVSAVITCFSDDNNTHSRLTTWLAKIVEDLGLVGWRFGWPNIDSAARDKDRITDAFHQELTRCNATALRA